ncbi:glycosyl hydrolase [Aliiruegeria lutimaris]|nr:glycosyl hydrolase [Aliiruegeria lutimaris]
MGASPFETLRARPTRSFLDSIGIVTTFPDRGQPLEKTIEMVRYCGFRWVRAGIEGLSTNGPNTIETMIELHRQTGALLNWGLVSGSSDLEKLIETGLVLARNGALLAFEGNNEPNNWGVTYQGQKGGGRASWLPVARLQRDLYSAVKTHPELRDYPVWTISEPGAQTDNVGLQFLEIPTGAGTLMPGGTCYADFANVHNYIYHSNSPGLADNKVWDAADPSRASRVDGLFGNFGRTWRKGFRGYSDRELEDLPRVTTETGVKLSDKVPETLHGLHLMNIYLAQFARGYAHTSVYILRDRTDEEGNQAFGFFAPDYSPRLAAQYLRNLTVILADASPQAANEALREVDLFLEGQTPVVHDLLLQRSDGVFQYVIWGEMLRGTTETVLHFARPPKSLRIFDPTVGTEPIQIAGQPEAVPLTLSDHPLIVQFAAPA